MEATRKMKSVVSTLGLLAVLALSSSAFAVKTPPAAPINVNSAGIEELTQIPGIGKAKAQAIVEFRTKAPYSSTEDLKNVNGIGDKLYAKIKDYVTVDSPQQNPGMAVKVKN